MDYNNSIENKKLFYISIVSVVITFILQYHVDIKNMVIRWRGGDFNFCFLVPLIFIYLIYENRKKLKNIEIKPSSTGFVLLLFSMFFYILGRLASVEFLTAFSVWLTILSLCFLIFGKKFVSALSLPFIVLLFIIPLPPFINNILTLKLKLMSTDLAVKIMQLIGVAVYHEGNIIDLGVTKLQVADACSGLRYFFPLVLIGLILSYILHKKWWERIIIVLLTIPVAIISNAFRIAITGYIAQNVSQETAEGFFHGFSGIVVFIISVGMILIFSKILKIISKREIKQENISESLKKIKFPFKSATKNLFIVSIIFLITWGAQFALNSTKKPPEKKSFSSFPLIFGNWEGKRIYLSKKILNSLWADDYILADFINRKTGDTLTLLIPYYKFQRARHTAHAPTSCLLGSGYIPIRKREIERVFPPPFGKVKITQMLLEKNGEYLLSNFWFQGRGRIIGNEFLNKWYIFWDSLTKHRSDGALIRIEMPIRKGMNIEQAQKIIDDFTSNLMKYLPFYLPN